MTPLSEKPAAQSMRRKRRGLVLVTIGKDKFELKKDSAESLRKAAASLEWNDNVSSR